MTTKAKQKQIDQDCEKLCNQVEEISALQATILRMIYRDKAPIGTVARLVKLPVDRVKIELDHAIRTAFNVVSGGVLEQWSTPAARDVPALGKADNNNTTADETAAA